MQTIRASTVNSIKEFTANKPFLAISTVSSRSTSYNVLRQFFRNHSENPVNLCRSDPKHVLQIVEHFLSHWQINILPCLFTPQLLLPAPPASSTTFLRIETFIGSNPNLAAPISDTCHPHDVYADEGRIQSKSTSTSFPFIRKKKNQRLN